ELDLVDDFEVGGVENENVVAEDVEIFSVGRESHLAAETEAGLIFILGDVRGANDFFLREIDHAEFRFLADVKTVLFFFDGAKKNDGVLALRIESAAASADLFVAVVQGEGAGDLAGRQVDRFEAALFNGRDVESLAIFGKLKAAGDAGRELDLIDDLLFGFVDHLDGVGPGADEERALRESEDAG